MKRLIIMTLIFFIFLASPVNALTKRDISKNYELCKNNYTEIIYKNKLFFAFGWDGRIKTSSDGITWSICETGITDSISDIDWNGKYYVAVGYDSILVSYDGFNWEYKGSTSFFFNDIFWDGKKFIATGGALVGCSISAGIAAWSNNGIDWSVIDVDFKEKENLITFDYQFLYEKGNYYLVGKSPYSMSASESDVIFVLSSNDGLTWKQCNDTSIYNNYNDILEVSGDKISIKFKRLSNKLSFSADQKEWKEIVLSDKYNLIGAAYGNNKFVLLDNNGRILMSDDTENWLETEKKNSHVNSTVFTGSMFLATGDDGIILISKDGQTWNTVQLSENYNILSVIYKNGIFVAVGYTNNGDFKTRGLILTSADGINWISKELNTDNIFTKVIYQYGKFKVFSGDIFVNDVLEFTSDNGYDWKPINQRNKALIFKTVTNGKNYIGLTGNTNIEGGLLISNDGVKWDRLYIRMYSPDGLNSIKYCDAVWNGKEYIVVGFYQEDEGLITEGIILSSKDGYNWKCLDGLTSNSIECAAYGYGKTIAISSEGLMLTLTTENEDNLILSDDNYMETYTEPYNYSKLTKTESDNTSE
ncbi:MAG: xynA [Eubacterium sp.]|jgi:hypothetical protein|nr:xynA [Eubacterium sp.]